MIYADDIESIYDHGSEAPASIRAERCLIASILQRAILDTTLVYTPKNTTTLCKRKVAVDAYNWIQDATEDTTPFSFVWCCNVLYPTCTTAVVDKIRALSDTVDLAHIQKMTNTIRIRRVT